MRITTAEGHVEWEGYRLREDGSYETNGKGACVRGPAPRVAEVRDAVWEMLTERERDAFDYFHAGSGNADELWPQDSPHILVASVKGGSEGDYIHVEAVGRREGALLVGKTFLGPDASWRLARRIARVLGVSE